MSLPFLLEIGTEEIPDWMIPPALSSLFDSVALIPGMDKLTLSATPRRLVLWVDNVPERRPSIEETVVGPAKSAPEKAVLGFAKKLGVRPEDLRIQSTPKGEYHTYLRKVEGRRTIEILAEALPEIILKITFPKSMYWTAKDGPRFIRPIRWIVSLLGDEVVRFQIAGVKAGNITSGHRILGAPQIPVTIETYQQRLRSNGVIVGTEIRRKMIKDDIAALGVRIKPDDALLETMVFLTEYPRAIQGSFDPEFLSLPDEVLSTVMRHHQKYFSVQDENGKLAPNFVAVTNTDGDRDGLIRRGNERVLRARFNDAKFFWETDQRKKLQDREADLKQVTFHAKLGSYWDKTDRLKNVVKVALGGDQLAIRAAQLCKCDLTTELVKEFTELQGIVGGLYARAQGEPDEVWRAIYDHYKPESMEDSIPRTHGGQLVSIADKLDTLQQCFGIGLVPSGSRDPYALRRAAQGIVKILVEGKVRISIRKFVRSDFQEFLLDRVRYYFRDFRGFKYDEVNAVLAAGWDDLKDVEERLAAIQAVRPTEDFEPLAASFKRIRNILRQAQFRRGDWLTEMPPDPGAEQSLYDAVGVVQAKVDAYRRKKDYRSALETIAGLRPIVDNFFDQVLVNDPDTVKRQRRLKLLDLALERFSTIADFSEIVTNT